MQIHSRAANEDFNLAVNAFGAGGAFTAPGGETSEALAAFTINVTAPYLLFGLAAFLMTKKAHFSGYSDAVCYFPAPCLAWNTLQNAGAGQE